MVRAYSKEKMDLIQSLQDAVDRSKQRLIIIKNINRRESVTELQSRLKIPQPTMSKSITRFKSFNLITLVGKKGNSEVYEKNPLLKTFTNLDSLINVDSSEVIQVPKKKIKAPRTGKSTIPYLTYTEERAAEEMAIPYTLLYKFENSLRNFIDNRLTTKYGVDWWNNIGIKTDLTNQVKSRKQNEGIHKWHVPRGAKEIFYTDLGDLIYLLNKEKVLFERDLDVEHWTAMIKSAISLSRNIIDHHNPLPAREIKRLKMLLEDWTKQLR